MKRVLMCTLAAPWPNKPLLGIFHAYQADALRKLGVEMKLFSPSPAVPRWAAMASPRVRGHLQRPTRYEMHGADVLAPRVPFAFPPRVRFGLAQAAPSLVDSWARVGLGRCLRAAIDEQRPDALIMHGAMPWGGLVVAEAQARGLPCAVIEHSADDVMRLRAGSKLSDYYANVARGVDAVFAVGPQMVDHLQQQTGIATPRLLCNGTSKTGVEQLHAPRPQSLRGKFVVLAAANYYRRKCFEELVDAFEAACEGVPEAQLHLVTAAPLSLREQIAASPMANRIVVHEPMPPTVLRQWMVWADVFALPSRAEAYGLVYAESFSAGTPVILTSDCGFAPVVHRVQSSGDRVAWVVPPDNSSALSNALVEASRDAGNCAAMGQVARQFADRELGWDHNARVLAGALSLCSA